MNNRKNPQKNDLGPGGESQVELMDLLGEEGIQNLPLLERLQHLDPGDSAGDHDARV